MSDSLEHIINEIANTVVLIDPHDMAELKDLLQTINQIDEPLLDNEVFMLSDVTERIILDDFESHEESTEALNKAVIDLQEAYKRMNQVDDGELEDKTGAISLSDAMEDDLHEDESEDHLDETLQAAGHKEDANEEDVQVDHEVLENDAVNEQIAQDTQDEIDAERAALLAEIENDPNLEASDELEPTTESEVEVQQEEPKAEKAKKKAKAAPTQDITSHEGYEDYFAQRDDPANIVRTLAEDPELVQGFIEEGTSNLQMIENGLLALEEEPGNLKIIDEIFRPFHTVKGVAGFLNLTEINSFCHGFESVLDDARKGDLPVTSYMTNTVFEAIDALRMMVDAIDESRQKEEYIPHGVDLDYFNHVLNVIRLNLTDHDEDTPTQEVVKTSTKPVKVDGPSRAVTKSADGHANKKSETSVRVSTDKMDILLDLVGELVLTQNMVTSNETIKRSEDKRLLQDMGQLKRITTSLQDLSMSLRMVPIKELFQKMNRIVRDLSKKSGKKIRLEYEGEDTEIDRNMVDELYEPMVHMIRNNCDHGVEMPDERVAAGKDETGTVFLNAFYRGGLVIIEITDDGRGIDAKKIKKIAADRGLCDINDDIPDKEVVNFIFAAGFSTAKEITDVSGRGVGMDVVRKAIEKLRGNIDVQTELGKGTTMSIRLPLTLAIIDGVIVRVGNERFIIPTTSIKESLLCPEESYSEIAGRGETVLIRNKVIPLMRLDRIFEIEGGVKHPKDGTLMIVESDGKEAAVPVNEMLDKQEIVIKSLGEGLNKIKGLSGGAIMSDGRVGLIVDVPTLIQAFNKV